jgi:hypothetical protein
MLFHMSCWNFIFSNLPPRGRPTLTLTTTSHLSPPPGHGPDDMFWHVVWAYGMFFFRLLFSLLIPAASANDVARRDMTTTHTQNYTIHLLHPFPWRIATTHTHHSPLTSTRVHGPDDAFWRVVWAYGTSFFLFLFFVTNPCCLSQQRDTTRHDDDPHPKLHHPPAPPVSVTQHDNSPLTTHLHHLHGPNDVYWHVVWAYGMFFLFFFFFVTYSEFLPPQPTTWHNATRQQPTPKTTPPICFKPPQPVFDPHHTFSTITKLLDPLLHVFDHHQVFMTA